MSVGRGAGLLGGRRRGQIRGGRRDEIGRRHCRGGDRCCRAVDRGDGVCGGRNLGGWLRLGCGRGPAGFGGISPGAGGIGIDELIGGVGVRQR
ncbi:MAG: hypothetical protein DWH87_04060 [Planctomycetota bacterium]|nr:MAG: hypothetical protein DWH87_04060 [Planctomycetota bacterium]